MCGKTETIQNYQNKLWLSGWANFSQDQQLVIITFKSFHFFFFNMYAIYTVKQLVF